MFVLDTNVVSELRKVRQGRADRNVSAWVDQVDADELYLSAITVQELAVGALSMLRKDAVQGKLLHAWLHEQVLPSFAGRILVVDAAVALRSATLHVPNPRPDREAWIAATALVNGHAVVTRNVADFAPTGVATINPWLVAPRNA